MDEIVARVGGRGSLGGNAALPLLGWVMCLVLIGFIGLVLLLAFTGQETGKARRTAAQRVADVAETEPESTDQSVEEPLAEEAARCRSRARQCGGHGCSRPWRASRPRAPPAATPPTAPMPPQDTKHPGTTLPSGRASRGGLVCRGRSAGRRTGRRTAQRVVRAKLPGIAAPGLQEGFFRPRVRRARRHLAAAAPLNPKTALRLSAGRISQSQDSFLARHEGVTLHYFENANHTWAGLSHHAPGDRS